MLDRTTAPEFKIPDEINLIEAERKDLSNGVPLYFIKGGDQDVVRLEFLFPAGKWQEGKPHLAGVANNLITDGTPELTADDIADKLDYYGAFFQTELTHDDASLVIYSLNKYLPEVLPVVRKVLSEASYPEEDVRIYCKNQRKKMQVNMGKVDYRARKEFRKLIYGEKHPYGAVGVPEDFDQIKRDEVLDFHRKHYELGNCTVIAAGMVDDEVIKILDKTIGSGKAERSLKEDLSYPVQTVKERKHFIEKEGALQCAIRIGSPMFNKTHADYRKMLVLNAVLGGYFSSRLMRNIREEKGYTYGIGSAIASHKHGGYFFLTTEVGAEVYKDALNEIYKEINLLRNELIPEEELYTVRNYLAGNLMKSVDGPFALAQRFKGVFRYDLGYDYYHGLLNEIKTITAEELRELASKYFKEEDLVELVVGQ